MTIEYLLQKLEEACLLKGRSVTGSEINEMPGFPCRSQYEKCGGIIKALEMIGRKHFFHDKERIKRKREAPLKMRFEILERDGFTCQYCGATPQTGARLMLDHVVPFSKGGKTERENLITSCFSCNIGKRDAIYDLLQKRKSNSGT